ncbi:MAG TPA: hypothetical protein VKQ08_02155, partial [Cyclobacteriaceae bacterium]|nr:hypothetical protein [Cyclobacteriaceae bacterium]
MKKMCSLLVLMLVTVTSCLHLCAQGQFFHPSDCWLYKLSGYGAGVGEPVFQGVNPQLLDIKTEMITLASQYDVPIEIIAGVCFQESELYQYGSDGFLVHNLKECRCAFVGGNCPPPPGLGMMQLTGSTAQGLNPNLLVADWRWNLEAGVKILSNKYDAALSGDPSNLQGLERANRSI